MLSLQLDKNENGEENHSPVPETSTFGEPKPCTGPWLSAKLPTPFPAQPKEILANQISPLSAPYVHEDITGQTAE